MQNVPVPTTIRIDPIKRELFEKLSHLHHKTISDICREGIDKELEKYLPAYCLHEKAAALRVELLATEEAAKTAEKVDHESLSINDLPPQVSDVFLAKREELFEVGRGTLMNQLKRNQTPAWDRIYIKYGFSAPKEMEQWVWKEAMSRGILT